MIGCGGAVRQTVGIQPAIRKLMEEPAVSRIQSLKGSNVCNWNVAAEPMVAGRPKHPEHRRAEPKLSLEESSSIPNDEALVLSALAGDAGAFDRLVERYAPRVFRMIRTEVWDASEAEDLVQETFLRAFAALPKFRFDSRFFTWLYRIMVNTVKEHQRKDTRRRELDAKAPWKAESVIATDASEGGPERQEVRESIWRALAELPEEYRTPLLLREWEELTYAEIAQALGCPPGTVASRIARARQMLAERLGSQ